MALCPVRKGQPLPEVLRQLLRQAAQAAIRPRYLLLDRGFCSVTVLRYLQRGRYPFLMPLVKRGRKADYPRGASGSRVFALWTKSGWGRYPLQSDTKERATVRVCVKCRNRRGERRRRGREALWYACGDGRRIDLSQWTFRGMLLWRQHDAEDWLGFVEEVEAQHSVWG